MIIIYNNHIEGTEHDDHLNHLFIIYLSFIYHLFIIYDISFSIIFMILMLQIQIVN